MIFTATRCRIRRKYFEKLLKEADKLYFHNFKLRRYLETNAILRFEEWLGSGFCYELSALAMILLKNNKTTRLCRGDYLDDDGNFKTHHAWVEFKVPFNGLYVMDLAWFEPAIIKKDYYFQECANLVLKWECTYNEFWKLDVSKAIHEAMKCGKTSRVLLDLSVFGNPDTDCYGFKDYCYEAEDLLTGGTFMVPYKHSHSGKMISSRILRDFVKNPRRKQPKARSIRLAHAYIKEVNRILV